MIRLLINYVVYPSIFFNREQVLRLLDNLYPVFSPFFSAYISGMADELGATSFNKYMPLSAAEYYAQFNDANDFYQKGPSFSESGNVTSTMAKGLKQDFFTQVDKVIDGNQNNVAVLRFTHAEIMIPLATSFELKNMMSPLPLTQTYNYQNSSWRGVDISPMAANMQWDIYKNGNNKVLVKMLYNEKETLFKPSCDSARYSKNSYFYDYQKLKLCCILQDTIA